MYTKVCKICKVEKSTQNFYKAKGGKFGVSATCCNCKKLKARIYYHTKGKEVKKLYHKDNKQAIQEIKKSYYQKNKQGIASKHKHYYQENKEQIQKNNKDWVTRNNGQYTKYQIYYRHKNKEQLSEKGKIYRKTHKKQIKKTHNNWKLLNADKLRAWRRNYDRKRRDNPMVRLYHNISRGINDSLKGSKCGRKWENIVGYSVVELKSHLESRFKAGMSWDNYGKNGWHIDHIIPRHSFNITSSDCDEFKRCWSINNLQPLWEKENLEKGKKIFS